MNELDAIPYISPAEQSDETRRSHALRHRIDEFVAQGWSITGRDPIRLEIAGRKPKTIQGGAICG